MFLQPYPGGKRALVFLISQVILLLSPEMVENEAYIWQNIYFWFIAKNSLIQSDSKFL